MKISVVLPCQNEEQTIGVCIEKINRTLKGEDYEIIVSDSSDDKSEEIARKTNARVVKHNLNGYGNAILKGLEHARGDCIIIGDADDTYDFGEIPKFIQELDKGYDLVIGDRFSGRIEKRAMPFSHRYFGTPVLNFLARIFFNKKLSDINSGFRAIKKDALKKLNLKTTGMEFASEMLVKSIKKRLKIKEIPVSYRRRKGKSKLRSFDDGWKHLRFMLLYSPNFVFFIPGLILTIVGFSILVLTLLGRLNLFGIQFQNHPMFVGSILSVFGYQLILTGIFARIYAHNHLKEEDETIEKLYRFFNLEKAILFGVILLLIGVVPYIYILFFWVMTNFSGLNTINLSVFAMTFIILGMQTIFSGFFFSILGINEK